MKKILSLFLCFVLSVNFFTLFSFAESNANSKEYTLYLKYKDIIDLMESDKNVKDEIYQKYVSKNKSGINIAVPEVPFRVTQFGVTVEIEDIQVKIKDSILGKKLNVGVKGTVINNTAHVALNNVVYKLLDSDGYVIDDSSIDCGLYPKAGDKFKDCWDDLIILPEGNGDYQLVFTTD